MLGNLIEREVVLATGAEEPAAGGNKDGTGVDYSNLTVKRKPTLQQKKKEEDRFYLSYPQVSLYLI
jgi:hypothetical protein